MTGSNTERRVPQLNDTIVLELWLPPQTEEWAEDLIRGDDGRDDGEGWEGYDCERTDDALIVRGEIGGNCNALTNASTFLSDLDDWLRQGDIDPMEFSLVVYSKESGRPPGVAHG